MTTTFPRSHTSTRLSVLPSLLARYVKGEVAQPFWNHLMRILDAGKANQNERIALAAFVEDAASELGVHQIKLPKPDEVESLLADTRY